MYQFLEGEEVRLEDGTLALVEQVLVAGSSWQSYRVRRLDGELLHQEGYQLQVVGPFSYRLQLYGRRGQRPSIPHSPECDAYYDKVRNAQQRYELLYPGFCRACGGVGGFHYPGTWWEPESYEICECLLAGDCPRCGAGGTVYESVVLGDVSCPHCGYRDGDAGYPQWEGCVCGDY